MYERFKLSFPRTCSFVGLLSISIFIFNTVDNSKVNALVQPSTTNQYMSCTVNTGRPAVESSKILALANLANLNQSSFSQLLGNYYIFVGCFPSFSQSYGQDMAILIPRNTGIVSRFFPNDPTTQRWEISNGTNANYDHIIVGKRVLNTDPYTIDFNNTETPFYKQKYPTDGIKTWLSQVYTFASDIPMFNSFDARIGDISIVLDKCSGTCSVPTPTQPVGLTKTELIDTLVQFAGVGISFYVGTKIVGLFRWRSYD